MKKKLLSFSFIMLVILGCKSNDEKTLSGLDKTKFQTVVNGDSTNLYVLKTQPALRFALLTMADALCLFWFLIKPEKCRMWCSDSTV